MNKLFLCKFVFLFSLSGLIYTTSFAQQKDSTLTKLIEKIAPPALKISGYVDVCLLQRFGGGKQLSKVS